jgi:hypothetical protein
MPGSWRTGTTTVQSAVVEVCWRPMDGESAGDFHDIIDLRDGRTAVIIGDAPGYGATAAVVADALQAETRRAFRESDDPVAVFERLDQLLMERDEPTIATATCVVIDPHQRQLGLVNAGHPPPILTTTGGVDVIDGQPDPLLGLSATRRLHTRRLPADATLFLYTDGLIERRGTPLDQSLDDLARLCGQLSTGTAWASEVARRAIDRFGSPADDVTVLSVRIGANNVGVAPVRLRVYVDRRDLRTSHTESVVRDLATGLRDRLDVRVDVVDVADPDVDTTGHGVMATPTVVRVAPEPVVRVVGALTNAADLAGLLQLPLPPTED